MGKSKGCKKGVGGRGFEKRMEEGGREESGRGVISKGREEEERELKEEGEGEERERDGKG